MNAISGKKHVVIWLALCGMLLLLAASLAQAGEYGSLLFGLTHTAQAAQREEKRASGADGKRKALTGGGIAALTGAHEGQEKKVRLGALERDRHEAAGVCAGR